MKSTYLGLFAGLFCVAIAACGADNKTVQAVANGCTPVTDADLVTAGFTAEPNACGAMMYGKYKHDGFVLVNNKIAELALAAPTAELGSSFQTKIADANTTRQQEFGAHLLSFLENAYGNPNAYVGPAMTPAHADLAITVSQYQYFVNEVVVPALTAVGVDSADISNCFAPTIMNKDFVKTVVTCK